MCRCVSVHTRFVLVLVCSYVRVCSCVCCIINHSNHYCIASIALASLSHPNFHSCTHTFSQTHEGTHTCTYEHVCTRADMHEHSKRNVMVLNVEQAQTVNSLIAEYIKSIITRRSSQDSNRTNTHTHTHACTHIHTHTFTTNIHTFIHTTIAHDRWRC